jgi:hypothetical protein
MANNLDLFGGCLDNFIGIRAACQAGASAPVSGLYIEDLPGISIKSLASVDAKYASAQKLVSEKAIFAGKKVLEMAREVIRPRFHVETAIDEVIGGQFNEDTLATTTNERGLRIEKSFTQLTTTRIPFVYVKSNTTVNDVDILVKEGGTTKLTKTVNLEAGVELCVDLNYETSALEVDIVIANNSVEPFSGSSRYTALKADCNSCGNGLSKFVTVRGLDNGTTSNLLFGIRAEVIIVCHLDKGLCYLRNDLKLPILYQTGIEILKEWRASDRMNFLTIHSQDWVEDTLADWEVEVDVLFKNRARGLANFLKSVDNNCFVCGGLSYGTFRP